MDSMKPAIEKIELLPPAERHNEYKRLAAHYQELSRLAHTESATALFKDMANEMNERAKAISEQKD